MPESQIVPYSPAEGLTIGVRFDAEETWLTRAEIAQLYGREEHTITEHLNEAFNSGELDRTATARKFRVVRTEGNRTVSRQVEHLSIDAILAVGYRVKSDRGTKFRVWATRQLRRDITHPSAPALDLAAVAGAVAAILIPQFKAALAAPMAMQPTIGEAEGARLNRALTQIGKAMHLGCPEKSAASWRQIEVLELREAVDHWGAWADLPAGKSAPAWRWTERRKAKVGNITGPRRQGALFLLRSKGVV